MSPSLIRNTKRLLDCLPQPVFVLDDSGSVLLMNGAARTLHRSLPTRRHLARVFPRAARLFGRRKEGSRSIALYGSAAGLRFRFVGYDGELFGRGRHLVVTVAEEQPAMVDVLARYGLTAREFEIAKQVAEQLSNEEIAQSLGISPHTVRNHVRNVLEKIGVKSRRRVRAHLYEK